MNKFRVRKLFNDEMIVASIGKTSINLTSVVQRALCVLTSFSDRGIECDSGES